MNDHGDIEIIRRDGKVDIVAAETLFDEYLSQPCDADPCGHIASYNQWDGKWCSMHVDHDKPMRARND